ncbi:hypothetical protein PINS_up011995 [Pythium insidiosum]|nr:hypothetical protein PINS_up011995 [Pythium insidiosum]
MDRLLQSIENQHPIAALESAILESRKRFMHTISSVKDDPQPKVFSKLDEESEITEDCHLSNQGEKGILALYENVVEAKVAATTTVTVTTKDPVRRTTPRELAETTTSAAFRESLERQREKAQSAANEARAVSHWQNVCANRIIRRYRKLLKVRSDRARLNALRFRTEQRAASIIQRRLFPVWRLVRDKRKLVATLRARNQARRISLFCFWRHLYPRRCARFSHTVAHFDSRFLAAVVRLQSHFRRRRALYELMYRRELQRHRFKRMANTRWKQAKRTFATISVLNLELADWAFHIGIERERVELELQNEVDRFDAEWVRYEQRLERDVAKSRLPQEWIPQLDAVSGESYFFNLQTGKASKEHPNTKFFRQLVKKQRIAAEKLLNERKTRLELYRHRLEVDDVNFMARTIDSLRKVLIDNSK